MTAIIFSSDASVLEIRMNKHVGIINNQINVRDGVGNPNQLAFYPGGNQCMRFIKAL